jgi:hypothetical protein
MPLRWKLFWGVCFLQMLSSSFFTIRTLIDFFKNGTFGNFISIVLFLLIFLQCILAISILNNNYPDVPVAGKQKTNFNRLFLFNFIFLVFLFGVIFAEYRQLKFLADFTFRTVFDLPFKAFTPLLINLSTLIFQFIIFYGLYELRRELYDNFMKKQFEFEQPNSPQSTVHSQR